MRLFLCILNGVMISGFCFAQQAGPQSETLQESAKRMPTYKIKNCERDSKLQEQLKDIFDHDESSKEKKTSDLMNWSLKVEKLSHATSSDSNIMVLKINSPIENTNADEIQKVLEATAFLFKNLKDIRLNDDEISPVSKIVEQGWSFGSKNSYIPSIAPKSSLDRTKILLIAPDQTQSEIILSDTLIERLSQELSRRKTKNKDFTCRLLSQCDEKSSQATEINTSNQEIQKSLEAFTVLKEFLEKQFKEK